MGQTALRARLLDEGHTAAPAMKSIACLLGNDRRANLNSARGLITGTALSDRITSRRGDGLRKLTQCSRTEDLRCDNRLVGGRGS